MTILQLSTTYFAHLSNLLLLIAFMVRDPLWLRWFAVAASLAILPYHLSRTEIPWPSVCWGAVFISIHLYKLVGIYRERRPADLSVDERKLYDMGFHSMRPREFLALTLAGEWRNAAPGHYLLRNGKHARFISIAVEGTVEISHAGKVLSRIPPGLIIGTAFAISGQPSPIDAKFCEPGRYVRWRVERIEAFMNRDPELRVILQNLLSHELAHKVARLLQFDLRDSSPPLPPQANGPT